MDTLHSSKQSRAAIVHRKKWFLELAGGIPYGLGSRLGSMFFNFPLTRLMFGSRWRLLQRVKKEMGESSAMSSELTRHLLGKFTIPWRVNALSRCSDKAFCSWVRIENEVVLANLKAADKPALLVNCHTAIARLVPLAVVRMGHSIATLEPEPYLQRMGARGVEHIQSITLRGEGEKFWLKEMFQAKKVLDEKRILHLALDGHQGTGGVAHVFLGRKRVFHLSLAKLAIQLGVPIILVSATLNERGQINMKFSDPLDLGDAAISADVKINRFLESYVAMIEKIWRDDLGNVSSRHLPPYIRSERMSDLTISGQSKEGAV